MHVCVCVFMCMYVHVYVRTWMHVWIHVCSNHACRLNTCILNFVCTCVYNTVVLHSNKYIQFNAYNSHVYIYACSCDLFSINR